MILKQIINLHWVRISDFSELVNQFDHSTKFSSAPTSVGPGVIETKKKDLTDRNKNIYVYDGKVGTNLLSMRLLQISYALIANLDS
jgi:hypothetical protein